MEDLNSSITAILAFIGALITASNCLADKLPEGVNSGSPVVYAVKIIGNRMTKEAMIKREMQLKPGVPATPELLESDRLHLASLGLFNHVETAIADDNNRAVVVVTVSEPLYYYLYPVLSLDADDFNRQVLGLGVYHRNFQGYGERLNASVWSGIQRGYVLSYQDLWYRFDGKYGIGGRISYTDKELHAPGGVVHRRERRQFYIEIRRRLALLSWLTVRLGSETNASDAEYYTYSESGEDRLLTAHLAYTSDQRDYKYYPAAGYYFNLRVESERILNNAGHNYYRAFIDMRRYLKVGGHIIAGRMFAASSWGALPYYRRVALSQREIRAGEDFEAAGWKAGAVNLEWRFPILPMRLFSFASAPLVGEYLINLKYSIEGVVFVDGGFSTYSVSGVRRRLEIYAWGCGFQFQLPYVETAHILAGWTPDDPPRTPTITARVDVTF